MSHALQDVHLHPPERSQSPDPQHMQERQHAAYSVPRDGMTTPNGSQLEHLTSAMQSQLDALSRAVHELREVCWVGCSNSSYVGGHHEYTERHGGCYSDCECEGR